MTSFSLRCVECGRQYDEDRSRLVCDACTRSQEAGGPTRGVLEVELDSLPSSWPEAAAASREFLEPFLPLAPGGWLPPLPVGGTPLLEVPQLRAALDLPHLYVKDDTGNPSGSTKDRASWLVLAKAREYGFDTVAAASTGNAATALAAVAASAGSSAVVFVPASAPEAKLVQMLSYGAEVLPVDGSYDDAFELCLAACDEFGWYNRNTALNPFTIEGKKTAALEIAASLSPQVPDVVIVPTGDGVILAGVAKGFADLLKAGLIERAPRLVAVQPKGSAAIVQALEDGADSVTPVPGAASVADSLVVESPRNGILALQRIRASGGGGVTVSEDAILAAIPFLAGHTGVFAEPAAAASLAGLHAALEAGLVNRDERIVLLVTGTGLKDVPAAARSIRRPEPIEPSLADVRKRLAEDTK
ncbi:MAG: threonine synthase [Gemmatimonadota bacterium]|nr:threonine synthase [Gemmatimonadota bacterium]